MLARWVGLCVRRAPWVVALTLLAAIGAFLWAGAHFQVDTDRGAMLSDRLAFKRKQQRIDRLFPQFVDSLVLVVDAPSPEQARSVALALAAELAADSPLFADVYVPRADPFLERHGLWYRSLDELEALGTRLARMQPFLGRLTRDPSPAGLFEMLKSVFEARAAGREVELGRIADSVDQALRAAQAGERRELSWQGLMSATKPSAAQRRQYVLAQPRLDYGRVFAGGPAIERVRELVAANGWEEGGISVRMTGGLALSHEELSSVLSGSERIASMVALMVAAVLYGALRSWRLVVLVLITLVVGLGITAAFALAMIGHFNLISIAFAALYLGLGVDYAIHFALRARQLVAEGLAPVEALVGTSRDVGGSLVLCALTTALGFFSFAPTAYKGVSELGLISGVGMFVSLAVTLTLFPALLALCGLRRTVDGRAGSGRRPAPVEWLIDLPVRHRRAVLAASAVVGLGALALAPRVRFDANPLSLRDAESESVATFRELLATSPTPPWSATLLASGLTGLVDLEARLAALDETGLVLTVSSFVPQDQDDKQALIEELSFVLGGELELAPSPPPHTPAEQAAAARALATAIDAYCAGESGAGDDAARSLSRTARAVADAIEREGAPLMARVEANLLANLPASLELLSKSLSAERVELDDLPTGLRRRWQAANGECRLEVYPQAEMDLEAPSDLERFVTAVQSVAPSAGGAPVEMFESGRSVVAAFRTALATAVVAIGLLVLVLLRRPLDVALLLGPLVLAGALTCATMALAGTSFNFANVIALPLLLGIGVDSGVHMVHRARSGEPLDNPLRSSTARGVYYSALTTICSFANIALSKHPGTASLGITLTIAIVWTLLAALVVLPALLVRRP